MCSSNSILSLISTTLSVDGSIKTQKIETGQKNNIQKLQQFVVYYQNKGLICDLEEAIASNDQESIEKATFFWLKGSFTCGKSGISEEYLAKEKEEADNTEPRATGDGYATSYKLCAPIEELNTKIGEYTISLACSLKYFSYIGAHRITTGNERSSDYFVSEPHSGNHFFFKGRMPATFEALIVLNGQDELMLYGSPLVLVNSFNPKLIL